MANISLSLPTITMNNKKNKKKFSWILMQFYMKVKEKNRRKNS